jgi:hypothetical protein
MDIKRSFSHKATETDFGAVAIDFPTKGWTLNGEDLPEASVRAVVNQGLQILQDTYAGVGKSKTVDEAKGMFDKKLAALIAGTVGQRTGGGGVDELTKVMRQIARRAARGQASVEEYKAFTAKPAAEQNERLDAIIDKNRDKLEAKAKAQIAERGKLAESIDVGEL